MGLGAIELRHQEVSGWVRIMVLVQQGSVKYLMLVAQPSKGPEAQRIVSRNGEKANLCPRGTC